MELPAADSPLVSVIVVTARKRDPLEQALAAITKTADGIPAEVVIALNGATEEVREFVLARASAAKVVESQVSLGFAGGLNLARERASGRYLAIVHEDAEPDPGWLATLIGRLDRESALGAVGGSVVNPDGTPQSTGVLLCRDGLAIPLIPECAPGLDLAQPRYVDFVSCSSGLMRAAAWDSTGGPDEDLFPSFFVDADLCVGMRRRGWLSACEPAARSVHARAYAGYPGPLAYVQERNRKRFAQKWSMELADHPPPEIGPLGSRQGSPEVLEAVEACQQRARAISAERDPEPGTPPALRDVDEARHRERAHVERAAEMWRGYAEQLVAERDANEAEIWRLALENEQLGESTAGLGAGTRWNRVRQIARPRTRARRLLARLRR